MIDGLLATARSGLSNYMKLITIRFMRMNSIDLFRLVNKGPSSGSQSNWLACQKTFREECGVIDSLNHDQIICFQVAGSNKPRASG